MKLFTSFFITCLSAFSFSQANLSGVWQGVLLRDGLKESEALIFYIDFKISGKEISGRTRQEVYDTDLYALQKIKGTQDKNKVDFKEFVIENKKASSKITWCSSDFKGEYIDSLGYIKGDYKSSTCKRVSGKFILYRSKAKFSETEIPNLGHAWRDVFLMDLKFGRKAPEIRDKERENFKFQPIFFDHDKTEIKLEFQPYLLEMIRVVNGHSDLRIQVTGHTDADGSDIYNVDLSQRRAKAIETFFKTNGLELKKLQIDFKGESEPIDNNQTEAGKKQNRRVDFKFI
ncbi:MAG: OmpA family protein [Bacteroidota bacterium]